MAAVITLTLGFVFNWRSHIGKRSLSKHDGFTFIKMELIRLGEPICLDHLRFAENCEFFSQI